MSFACEVFIYKKKNESTTQRILLSGLNTGNKKGLRESEQWRLPSLSINVDSVLFFIDLRGGAGEEGKCTAAVVPALVPTLRGGRNR